MQPRRLRDYIHACGDLVLNVAGDADMPISNVVNDSRLVTAGSLFIAIQGFQDDGRRYLGDAIGRGAAAAVYAGEPRPGLGVPAVQVSGDYEAFGRLAECYWDYPGRKLTLIGVTGTNGKTTTALLIRQILHRAGVAAGLISTVGYELGDQSLPGDRTTPTPLELQSYLAAMVNAGQRAAVMEVSSHALAQRRMGSMQFDIGVFSNLSRDHLDYHVSMDDYFEAKKRLFTEYLSRDGTAVINADDSYGRRLREELTSATVSGTGMPDIIMYGCDASVTPDSHSASDPVDCFPRRMETSMSGTQFECICRNAVLSIASGLIGRFNVFNTLAAIACGVAAEAPVAAIETAVNEFAGVAGRMQRLQSADGVTVIVDYAHTDDALRNVLGALRSLCQARLITVFGCGGNRDRTKREPMGVAAADLSDVVIVTSDNPRNEDPMAIIDDILAGIPADVPHEIICDRAEAITSSISRACPNDTVLVAGKGHEDYQEVKGRRRPFSDVDVSRAAMAAREERRQ